MILITGGFGFLGSNTAEALAVAGQDCVLTQHDNAVLPAFLDKFHDKHVFTWPADVNDVDSLRALGANYKITGVIHLATGGLGPGPGADALESVADISRTVSGVANVVQAAYEWGVRRVLVASAPVIYAGVTELPWREDAPLPMTAHFSMEVAKKCAELVASYLAVQTAVECVSIRLGGLYGPHYDTTRGSLLGRLVRTAVSNDPSPVLEGIRGSIHADDSSDLCYVKDAARAIAALQTAETLQHGVYNVASGRPTTNRQVVAAVARAVPGFSVDLPGGHMPGLPDSPLYLDTTRLRTETGFEPAFDLQAGVDDYVGWLTAGNQR